MMFLQVFIVFESLSIYLYINWLVLWKERERERGWVIKKGEKSFSFFLFDDDFRSSLAVEIAQGQP